jgi:voltage-gated potassium channel
VRGGTVADFLSGELTNNGPMLHKKNRAIVLRQRAYDVLEHGPIGHSRMRVVSRLLILLIVINLIAVVLESVPRYEHDYGRVFLVIEMVSLVVFTAEYLLRVWAAVEHAPYRHLAPIKARLQFIVSLSGIVDLVSVLPFWFAFFVPSELRVILIFRIVRFLKLARYSPAIRSLLDALYSERRALFGCVLILLGTALIAASLMHLAERGVQPDKLGTIPDAMWWAIVTLGTIGYGDVVPVTPLGKIIASITIFGGLIMIALPVGIIATAFSEQIHRRDFVVTWTMVARVPLFAGLDAGEIADILRLLRAQTVESGDIIVRRGDPAHSMYFIADGEVEIATKGRHVRLGVGQFFGEVSVLQRARRTATVTAIGRTRLLVLDAEDLHALMEREPRIAEQINATVRVRGELFDSQGDIAADEIEGDHASR